MKNQNMNTVRFFIGFVVAGLVMIAVVALITRSLPNTNQPNQSYNSYNIIRTSNTNKALYANYSDASLKNAPTEIVGLFFHASWCPTCAEMEKNLLDNFDQLNNFTILKVDYDTNNQLKQQYAVTQQSTWVWVNREGVKLTNGTGFTSINQINGVYEKLTQSLNATNNSRAISSSSTTAPVIKGAYQTYSPELVANAENSSIILFFNASWCPTCQATQRDINSKLSLLPDNFLLLSVDYDKYTDLRKKYGITYQHTFVHVDTAGNMIKKQTGLNDLESIIAFAN